MNALARDTVREPTAYARLLAGLLKSYGARPTMQPRRFSKLAKAARYLHLRRGLCSTQLGADSRFIFPLGDRYWHKVFLGLGYEPNLEWVLRRAKDVPYALIDCGANMGYWSVMASGVELGSHFVVAVEASKRNFELLANNARANGNRFRAIHRAVTNVSGEKARLFGTIHFGRSLLSEWHKGSEAHSEEVETMTVDDVASKYLPGNGKPVVLKLDVEGVEVAAMEGGRKTIEAGALVIFEDHVKEAEHPASKYMLGLGDMEIWYLGREQKPAPVKSIDDVVAAKKIKANDFFAYKRGSPWANLFREEGH